MTDDLQLALHLQEHAVSQVKSQAVKQQLVTQLQSQVRNGNLLY
jgi:anti-sigma28 factor (negative regulator of flagellin synthesis)